ncbi:hypothetical protein QSV36_12685 [Pseudomonas sp. BCRC 81390]|uniref:hypothetical protein n=1 Tax=Pseudomonas sp. BCRC 81390 TaxID=3054778 RepID=UPI002591DFE4|nr:hypothetical protein [Pseudomonas sp. BCRC 81390]MDM3886441.1 hypothetical protein [Pseudomonas sp. BCRC 81390]
MAVTLIALPGCQHQLASEAEKQARQTFVSDMQQALTLGIATADTGPQIGVVMLNVKLDSSSAPVSCKASRAPFRYEIRMPAELIRTGFKSLASVVEAQCWKTIYPVVPKALRDDNGTAEIRAPLFVVLPASAQAPGTERRQSNAQRDFFWQRLFSDLPVDSIGRASVYYEANAQGEVQGCLVQIHPHPLRPDDFRLDGNLQARLNSRCMALDLATLPGFKAESDGLAKGYSEMEYAPWKVRVR